jgi:hypothetical protein
MSTPFAVAADSHSFHEDSQTDDASVFPHFQEQIVTNIICFRCSMAVEVANTLKLRTAASNSITLSGAFAGAANIDAHDATFNQAGRDLYINYYMDRIPKLKDILTSPLEGNGSYVTPCMSGTRETIFKEVYEWLADIDSPNVLWISGNPGAGKSAIASSLASRLTEGGRLGSSFFFKRGDVILSNPASLWRTVAYDLAEFDTVFSHNLWEALECKRVNPGRPDIPLHFKYLIKEPLTKSYHNLSPPSIPVIVIDALDECDCQGVRQRQDLMDTLAQWSFLPKTFKLIVTSRDEHFISAQFRAICKQVTLPTGNFVNAEANRDIRCFFEQRFTGLPGLQLSDRPWTRVLDVLTAQAAGLFIWAETVVRFVEQGLPTERLDLVLNGDMGGADDITKLYRQVLDLSFSPAVGSTLTVFKHVVGAIIAAKGPVHYEDLHQLVSEPQSSVMFILDKLSSVVSIGDTDKCVRIGHLSFTEFLCNQQRCPEQYCINQDLESQKLAMACFRLMKDGLKFNICDLGSSHLLNDEVKDLSQRIETNISAALLYSCRFWAAHLRDITINSEVLMKEVEDFFHNRLLFWLEVMSLKKEIAAANIALLTVASWIKVSCFPFPSAVPM